MGATRGHGPRGTDDHVVPLGVERGALARNLHHARLIELAAAAGENAGAQFDDDALVHGAKYSGCGGGSVKP